ncbi:MAG: hypothetical protein VYB10_06370 [Actinomycetota bacterium]|nr:hypothetical protein [Actinomycetota bacterium]
MGNLKLIRTVAIVIGAVAFLGQIWLMVVLCAGVAAWATIKARSQDQT